MYSLNEIGYTNEILCDSSLCVYLISYLYLFIYLGDKDNFVLLYLHEGKIQLIVQKDMNEFVTSVKVSFWLLNGYIVLCFCLRRVISLILNADIERKFSINQNKIVRNRIHIGFSNPKK